MTILFSEVAEQMLVKVRRTCGRTNERAVREEAAEVASERVAQTNLVFSRDVNVALHNLDLYTTYESGKTYAEESADAETEKAAKPKIVTIRAAKGGGKTQTSPVQRVSRKKGR